MIDVIIPAYNSHNTIGTTLASIAKQINRQDVKVYIVNDGSDRDYSEIINNFKSLLDITEVYIENSGPGKARQVGLDSSSNEYIVFIDSDDVLYNEFALVNLISIINDVDYSQGCFLQINENDSIVQEPQYCYLHGKMYRRSIIEKYNIKFNNPKYKSSDLYEDSAFNQLYSLCANSFNSTKEIVYTYNYNPNSLTKFNEDKVKNLHNFVKEMTWLCNEINKRNITNLYLLSWNLCIISYHIYFNYLLNEKESSFVFKEMKTIKNMYNKYIEFLPFDDQLAIYKLFNYPVIPSISFNEFLNKVID